MLVGAVQGGSATISGATDTASEAPAPVINPFRTASVDAAAKPPAGSPIAREEERPAAGAPLPQLPGEERLKGPVQSSLTVRARYDNDLNRTFLELYDRSSAQVIIQFPPEKLIKYFNDMADKIGHRSGGLVNLAA